MCSPRVTIAAIALCSAQNPIPPQVPIETPRRTLPSSVGFAPGKSGFDVPQSVKLEPQDLRIVKTYSNSFTKTGLAEKLKELGVDTVIVSGFCAEFCVLNTYRGAEDFDFKPIMLKGSLASDNAEHIRFVEEISETISFGALKTLL